MNKDQKAAVIDSVAAEIERSEAIVAVDYRGLSVEQAADLRGALSGAGASFRIVKNTLTERAADKAGAESLKGLLEGPTALTFVRGDVALAAKALATFRRETGVLAFKGGRLGEEPLEIDQIEAIARLPGRDALQGQFVGVLASPLTTLVRGLGSLIGGLAVALSQVEQGLLAAGASEGGSPQGEPAVEAEAAAKSEPATEPGEAEADAAAEAEPSAEPASAAEPSVEAAEEAGRAAEAETEVGAEPSASAEAKDGGDAELQDQAEEDSNAPSGGGEKEPEEG